MVMSDGNSASANCCGVCWAKAGIEMPMQSAKRKWDLMARLYIGAELFVSCSSSRVSSNGRSRSRRRPILHSRARLCGTTFLAHAHAIKREVNHRGGVEGKHLRNDQAAHDGDTEWFTQFT